MIYGLFDPRTNKIKYIGYTSKTLKDRLSMHMNYSTKKHTNKRALWLKELKGLGLKPTIKVIERHSCSLEEIELKEMYWIKYFKKRFDLVNTTNGGKGASGLKWTKELYVKRSKKVSQYSLDGTLIHTYNSIIEAAKTLNKPRQDGKISSVCRGLYGRNTAFGFVWRYDGDPFTKYSIEIDKTYLKSEANRLRAKKNQTGATNSNAQPILQYDLNWNFLKEFGTSREVQKFLKLKTTQYLKYCSELNKPYHGFYWKYKIKI